MDIRVEDLDLDCLITVCGQVRRVHFVLREVFHIMVLRLHN